MLDTVDSTAVARRRWRFIRSLCGIAMVSLPWLLAGCQAGRAVYQSPAEEEQPEGALVEVEFSGNDGVDSFRLKWLIESDMLEWSRHPEQESHVEKAAAVVIEAFGFAGYPDAQVSHSTGRTPAEASRAERLTARFEIAEGPFVTVHRLDLSGREKIAEPDLLRLWPHRPSGFMDLGAPIFSQDEIDHFVDNLRGYYRELGYFDASIADAEVERTDLGAEVTIAIEEGELYDFGDVEIAPKIAAVIRGQEPDPPSGRFVAATVRDYLDAVAQVMRNQGHPEPKLAMAPLPDRQAQRLDLRVMGAPGARAIVAGVDIRGNKRTKESFIRDRLAIRDGSLFDGRDEARSLRNLRETGLFRRIEVKYEWLDDDRVQIILDIKEADSPSVSTKLGYHEYEKFRGVVRVEEKNLFGTGKRAAFEQRLSYRGWRSSVDATDPAVFGGDLQFRVEGEIYRAEWPSFNDKAWGSTVSLEHPILDDYRAGIGYTYRDHFDANAQDPTALVDYVEGGVSGSLGNRDSEHPIFARDGHEEFVDLEVIKPNLGANVDLTRLHIGLAAHVPVYRDLRLLLRTEQGWLWPGDGSDNVPLQERFYLGGINTVRGFGFWTLGPKNADGGPAGGEYMTFFSAELTQPLWQGGLEVAGFVDAGNVGANVSDYSITDLRWGLGGGLRLWGPLGPVRLDAGYNPDRRAGESLWVFHFMIGLPF